MSKNHTRLAKLAAKLLPLQHQANGGGEEQSLVEADLNKEADLPITDNNIKSGKRGGSVGVPYEELGITRESIQIEPLKMTVKDKRRRIGKAFMPEEKADLIGSKGHKKLRSDVIIVSKMNYLQTKPYMEWDERDRVNYQVFKKDKIRPSNIQYVYEFVMRDIKNSIPDNYLAGRYYVLDSNQQFKTATNGQYYCSLNGENLSAIVATFVTPKEVYEGIEESERYKIDLIKRIVNMVPTCVYYTDKEDGQRDLHICMNLSCVITFHTAIQEMKILLLKIHPNMVMDRIQNVKEHLKAVIRSDHTIVKGMNNDAMFDMATSMY